MEPNYWLDSSYRRYSLSPNTIFNTDIFRPRQPSFLTGLGKTNSSALPDSKIDFETSYESRKLNLRKNAIYLEKDVRSLSSIPSYLLSLAELPV